MTQTTSNSDPRVIAAIKHSIDLQRKGQTELAVQHLSALIPEFPMAASMHAYLAFYLSRIERFDEAIEHGRQAILLSPKSEKASFILFSALWSAGQHIEALDEMKRFLTIKPSKIYSGMIKEWDLGDDQEDID